MVGHLMLRIRMYIMLKGKMNTLDEKKDGWADEKVFFILDRD